MTDEEKAEEYLKINECEVKGVYNSEEELSKAESYCDGYSEGLKNGYLDGLADGRKEKCLEQNKDGTIRPCELLKDFEKDKCELLGIIQGKDEVIANFKEQNKDLCESLDIMNNRESELLDQIEKMKCCYNCKYGRIYFVNEIIVDCLANKVNPNNKYENCDKWELAE